MPPVRVVEDGELRRDLEEEYMRRSRMPELVAVDLRAQIAGYRVAVERMESLLSRYGAPTLKSVMRKIQDDSERAFVNRLDDPRRRVARRTLSEWPHRATATCTGTPSCCANRASDSSSPTRAPTRRSARWAQLAAWSGAISAMVNSQLMFDQLFAIGGALRGTSISRRSPAL